MKTYWKIILSIFATVAIVAVIIVGLAIFSYLSFKGYPI